MNKITVRRLLLLILLLCLPSCSDKEKDGASKTRGILLDRDSMWKVCMDVVSYKAGFIIITTDKTRGHIDTDWNIDEAWGSNLDTVRRHLTLDLLPVGSGQSGQYRVDVHVDLEESTESHLLAGLRTSKWKSIGRDTGLEKRTVNAIENRCASILENRALGLSDPTFHDFKLGVD